MTLCTLCNRPLTPDTIAQHNRSGCLALRSPEPPHHIVKRLESRVIKRWRSAERMQDELREG